MPKVVMAVPRMMDNTVLEGKVKDNSCTARQASFFSCFIIKRPFCKWVIKPVRGGPGIQGIPGRPVML